MREERIQSNPGPLRGGAHLTLQTHHGARLLRGRSANEGKPAITGLVAFASQLKPIWAAAIKDDPYADWWLYRIEQSILRSRNALRDLQARLENALGSVSGLEIPPGESTEPVQVDIQFSAPLAFKAAQMLAEYDCVSRTYLTIKHVGLGTADLNRLHWEAGRRMRGVFLSATGYQDCEITRQSVRNKTPKALKAQELMGELPGDILCGDQVCSLLPKPNQAQ